MSKPPESVNPWRNPLAVDNAAGTLLGQALAAGERLKSRLAQGRALGSFLIELPCPAAVRSIALAGFEFVVIDMEHSSVDFTRLETLLIAAQSVGLATLVRTWSNDEGLIGKALDLGANGILAAHVESAAQARAIVDQARFAPRGLRGFSPLVQYDSLAQPFRALDAATYVAVQIEGRSALASVAEIAAVDGVDAIFVGPYDLALSLNVAPNSDAVFAAAERVAAAVPAHVTLGLYLDDPARCADWLRRRFRLQCVSFDGRMLANGARAIAAQARIP
jgi:2-keto-3-deoxy-L-rhamnonate aldolase RhmA